MANVDAMIRWYEDRLGKVTYSMENRYGPSSYDCSSSCYYALVAGGFLPSGSMGNTETLFGDLENAGWGTTASPKRGDVFIWGVRGASGGAYGHTGVFYDETRIIHCNGSANGISIDNYYPYLSGSGSPQSVIYSNPDSGKVALVRWIPG